MKPLKSLLHFATWLMRLSVTFFVIVTFYDTLKSFDIKSIQFYLALVFTFFTALLFIGGFLKKPAITVFSGIMLFAASVFKMAILFSSEITVDLAIYAVIATISLYFVTAGNK